MKWLAVLALALPAFVSATVQGIDVSHFQGTLSWNTIKSSGVQWAYIKATEGTTFIDPTLSQNYIEATNAGLIRGAYHFAHPDTSTGAAQATLFLANGGDWSADGITLPGAIDLEGGCYGKTQAAMVTWIEDFSTTYHAKTGRFPVIYTTTSWWKTCTGNASGFQVNNPLWIAHWASSIGELPAGYTSASFWQYADSGPHPGDQDFWNGDNAGLRRMAEDS